MKIDPPHLYERIASYSPDEPGADFPYSARLARDNDWSPDYTQRVVEEYKRFAYLAMAAGHPVTPSDQVDQAWHLHMIYTRSYWSDFCEGVLGSPLHHSPTKGGNSDQEKFIDWYGRTLESYRRLFNEEPRADIWPPAGQRFGEDIRFLRVNAKRNWVLRKPRWWRWLATRSLPRLNPMRSYRRVGALGIAGLVGALAGCQRLVGAGVVGPGVSGSEFIGLFIPCALFGLAAAACLRISLRRTEQRPIDTLDRYSAGYLAGEGSRVFDAIVVNLVQGKFLTFDKKGATLSRTELPISNPHPLEQLVYDRIPAAPSTAKVSDLRSSVRPLFAPLRDSLRDKRLWLTTAQACRATLWPLLIALIVPLIGVLRILYGISRDKPVGILTVLTITTGIIALGIFARRARRSHAGDRALQHLKKKNHHLRKCRLDSEVSAAVGLFGVGCLQGTAYTDLTPTLTPKSNSAGCGGGCGGGDGGGGGGGCGGGGCGGCGGCGG